MKWKVRKSSMRSTYFVIGPLAKCLLKMNLFTVISQIFSLLSGNVCFERILWLAGSTRLPLPKSCMKKIHMQENTQKKSCRKIYLMKTCTLIFLLLDWIISICTATYLQLKYWKIIRWAATNYCWLLYRHMTALNVKRHVYFRQFAR